MLPIAITTKDRPAYLDTTLRSLSASLGLNGGTVPENITVYADKPETEEGQRILETGDVFQLSSPVVWRHHPRRCLPPVSEVTGVKGRFKLRVFPVPTGAWGVPATALIDAFEQGAEAAIVLQDDVVFKEDWYHVVEGSIDQSYGVISFLQFRKKNNHLDRVVDVTTKAVCPAQCLLVMRSLFEENEKGLRETAENKRPRQWDSRLRRIVRAGGLKVGLNRPGVVQHIGQISQCWYKKAQKLENRTRNFRPRVDKTVKPPYCGIDVYEPPDRSE